MSNLITNQDFYNQELNVGNSFRSQLFASRLLAIVLCVELVFSLLYGNLYSPFFAYWRLAEEAEETARVRKAADQMVSEGMEHPTEFELVTAICFLIGQKVQK